MLAAGPNIVFANSIIIPKLSFTEYTMYVLQVAYKNVFNIKGITTLTLTLSTDKGPYVEIIQN